MADNVRGRAMSKYFDMTTQTPMLVDEYMNTSWLLRLHLANTFRRTLSCITSMGLAATMQRPISSSAKTKPTIYSSTGGRERTRRVVTRMDGSVDIAENGTRWSASS